MDTKYSHPTWQAETYSSHRSQGVWVNLQPSVVLTMLFLWGAASAMALALVTHLVAADAHPLVLELFDRVALIVCVATGAALLGLIATAVGNLKALWRTRACVCRPSRALVHCMAPGKQAA